LAFATFLVWRLRTGACGVDACGFWRYRMPPVYFTAKKNKKINGNRSFFSSKIFYPILELISFRRTDFLMNDEKFRNQIHVYVQRVPKEKAGEIRFEKCVTIDETRSISIESGAASPHRRTAIAASV